MVAEDPAAEYFWQLLPEVLRARARLHIRQSLTSYAECQDLLVNVLEQFRQNCNPCALSMIQETHKRLLILYTHLEDYSGTPANDGRYRRKLEALLKPNPIYNGSRHAFFRPGPDEALNVGTLILEVLEQGEFSAAHHAVQRMRHLRMVYYRWTPLATPMRSRSRPMVSSEVRSTHI